MNMPKFIVLLFLLVTTSLAGSAQKYMHVTPHSGDKDTYVIADVSRIDFGDEGITVITDADGGQTYTFQAIRTITFNDNTAVTTVKQDPSMTLYHPQGSDFVYVKGWNGTKSLPVRIYAVNGAMVINLANWNGEPIDISALDAGIYIITLDNQSTKFIK